MNSRNARIAALSFSLLGATMLSGVAQAGEVAGTVVDATRTRVLQSAEVEIVELHRIAEAEKDGSFRFPDVPAGTYTVTARYAGAATATNKVTVDAKGTARLDITLGELDDTILVIGQQANLSSSISRQRAADGVESVLTRDSIGQFPDQNVAESIRRLPGVNILNDQGEGRFVSVRGLDPELNAASINGVRVPAPESDVRSVALDVIPSELIESIEIKKSLTPDMDADTIGASIEINTTSAFDRKKDLLGVKLEGSYNDYSEKLTPKASVDFSTRLGDDFGIAGGFSYYKRKFETDNIEAAGWNQTDDGIAYAEEVEYRDYDVERERIGGSLSFDWRASDSTKLYARGLYSQFSDQEYRRRLAFVLDEAPASGTASSAQFTDEDGRIEVRRDIKDRFERQRIGSLTIGGETVTGPWKLTYSGAYSQASERENGSLDPTRFRARFDGDGVDVNFDYSNPRKPLFDVTSGADLFTDPEQYSFNRVERTALSDSKDKEFQLKADVSRAFVVDGGTFTVQAGAKARWRKKRYDFNLEYYGDFDGDYTLADVVGTQTYRIIDISPVPSKTGATDFFYNNRDGFELDPIESAYGSASSDYRVDEDIIAGYLLGRWDSPTLRVIGGVRIEKTKNDIRANLTELVAEGDTHNGVEVTEDTVFVTPNQFRRDYTDVLPSLTVRYEPVQNVVLRLGGYRSLVRPKLSNLAPRFLIDEDRVAEFGNPELKPYRAWNIDASAEWYFSRNAALTAGVFWKSIKDFVVKQRDFDDGSYNGIDYSEATFFANGDTAKIKGIELSYNQAFSFLPAPFDGLLLNLNYTYTDAKGTVFEDGDVTLPREIALPSSSKHTFNASVGYDKGPISLRAAGTYRSKYLDEIGDTADTDRIVASHFQLDLSAKYRITDGVRIFAEWVNVTDAPYFAYQSYAGARRILQYEEYSWTAKFGVSANF